MTARKDVRPPRFGAVEKGGFDSYRGREGVTHLVLAVAVYDECHIFKGVRNRQAQFHIGSVRTTPQRRASPDAGKIASTSYMDRLRTDGLHSTDVIRLARTFNSFGSHGLQDPIGERSRLTIARKPGGLRKVSTGNRGSDFFQAGNPSPGAMPVSSPAVARGSRQGTDDPPPDPGGQEAEGGADAQAPARQKREGSSHRQGCETHPRWGCRQLADCASILTDSSTATRPGQTCPHG